MKYIKKYEEKILLFKRYVILKRENDIILVNVINNSFFGEDDILYNVRFIKKYTNNTPSKMYEYKNEVIYPDDEILYETNILTDAIKELTIINDMLEKTIKYNI